MKWSLVVEQSPVADMPSTAHGTTSGYTHYACRCAKCTEAMRAYIEQWRKRGALAKLHTKRRLRVLIKSAAAVQIAAQEWLDTLP